VVSSLVEAARFNWAYQAELARSFLESHGLQSVVFDAQSSLYSDGALVGVRLMVLDEDLEFARTLLAEDGG
jgi:ATP phosphoribosyltransferase regulatory subunit HisZ